MTSEKTNPIGHKDAAHDLSPKRTGGKMALRTLHTQPPVAHIGNGLCGDNLSGQYFG
jgi:hypothetical protein